MAKQARLPSRRVGQADTDPTVPGITKAVGVVGSACVSLAEQRMKAHGMRKRRNAVCIPSENKDLFLRRLHQAQQQAQKPSAQVAATKGRAQLECLTAYFAEMIGKELPSDLSSRLQKRTESGCSATSMEDSEFMQLCEALAREHNTCNPCLFSGNVVKQGWVYKRAGKWSFWHRYFAVLRGKPYAIA